MKKLVATPAAVTAADARAALAAGVSPSALEDAIYVCTMFSVIVRMADTLEFYLPDEAGYLSDAGNLLKRGYRM